MAQYRLDNQEIGHPGNRYEIVMLADQFGQIVNPLGTAGHIGSSLSAFGEMISVPVTPIIQADAVYGIEPDQLEVLTSGGGTVTGNTIFQCASGTTPGGYGVLRSRRVIRYRPGQGAVVRFTAAFSSPSANTTQRAGAFSQENALMVGYNNTSFGVLRAAGGRAHIHTFTGTAAASGAETVTVTLNGTPYTVPITAGSIEQNIATIGHTSYPGWLVEHYANTVSFLSTTLGPKSGTFSLVTSNGGTFAGTGGVAQTGVAQTDHWTPQSQWNGDRLDGTGPSQMLLDPAMLNVYQIDYRWLGVGKISYCVEDQRTGQLIAFHTEHYTNQHLTPHITNPSLKLGYVAASMGTGSSNVVVTGASMMGGIQGLINVTDWPTAVSATRTDSMSSASSYYHLITVRNGLIHNNHINAQELLVKSVSAAATIAGGGIGLISLYIDAVPTVDLSFAPVQYHSSVLVSKTQTTINTTATLPPIFEFYVTSGDTQTIPLDALRIIIPPNAQITATVQSAGTISAASAAITFVED